VLPRTNEDVNEDGSPIRAGMPSTVCCGKGWISPMSQGRKASPCKLAEPWRHRGEVEGAGRLEDSGDSRRSGRREALIALKDLMTALGSTNLECRQDGGKFDPHARAGYLFNSTIAGIDQADAFLIVVQSRWEAPIINAASASGF